MSSMSQRNWRGIKCMYVAEELARYGKGAILYDCAHPFSRVLLGSSSAVHESMLARTTLV